jgi:hypothetical protein
MLRILLDENLPTALSRLIVGHHVTAAFEMGWAGISNGDLIAAAEAEGRGPHNGGPEHSISAESNRPPIDPDRLEHEHLADHPRQPCPDFGGSRTG